MKMVATLLNAILFQMILLFIGQTTMNISNPQKMIFAQTIEMNRVEMDGTESNFSSFDSYSHSRVERQANFLRTSILPTEEYILATSSPFFKRGILTWDAFGNTIINAKYSAHEQEVILHVRDDTYSQLLLSDLATLKKEPKMPIAWKRLSICFVLAMRRKEPPNTVKVSFHPIDCNEDHIFEIDQFLGNTTTKMLRMESCYNDDVTFDSYSNCLLRKIGREFGTFKEDYEVCDKVKGNANFLNSKFGSHLREICYAQSSDIYKHFEDEMYKRNKLHEVQPFDTELCILQTYFRPGKMVLCFPAPENIFGLKTFSTNCQKYGYQSLVIQYFNATVLSLQFGDNKFANNAQKYIYLDLTIPPDTIKCYRLAFNLYMTSPENKFEFIERPFQQDSKVVKQSSLPADFIVVPIELISVQGHYPHAIKCYWNYSPTIHKCNNLKGSKPLDCGAEIPSTISTGIAEMKLWGDHSEDMMTGIGVELAMIEQIKLSAARQSTNIKKFLDIYLKILLYGVKRTRIEKLSAEPGQWTELWQLCFTCLNKRFFLPLYQQKDAGKGIERNQFPPEIIGSNRGKWGDDMMEMERGKNNEDFTANLPQTIYGNLLSLVIGLHKGICDHPLAPEYNETQCNFFKFPDDLAKSLLKSIGIDMEQLTKKKANKNANYIMIIKNQFL